MALNKSIDSGKGIEATYWRIGSIVASCDKEASLIVKVDGYLSEESYQAGAEKLITKTIQSTFDKEFTGNIFEAIYQQIKGLEDFKDSIDV